MSPIKCNNKPCHINKVYATQPAFFPVYTHVAIPLSKLTPPPTLRYMVSVLHNCQTTCVYSCPLSRPTPPPTIPTPTLRQPGHYAISGVVQVDQFIARLSMKYF